MSDLINGLVHNTMSVYLNTGLIAYTFIAIIFLYSSKSKPLIERLVFLAFIFYIGKVLDLTLFPIPLNHRAVAESSLNYGIHTGVMKPYNLIPFTHVLQLKDMREPLLNVLMTLPFGIFTAYISPKMRSFKSALYATFLLSLTLEILELMLTLTFGFVGWHFDTSDLITNTLGGLLGFCIYKWIINPLQKSPLPGFKNKQFPTGTGAVLLGLFIWLMLIIDVSAVSDTYSLKLNQLIANGRHNHRYFEIDGDNLVLDGSFTLIRRRHDGQIYDHPSIELRRHTPLFDFGYGKHQLRSIILEDDFQSKDIPFFIHWTSLTKGKRYYFITESQTVLARKEATAKRYEP